MKLTKSQLKQIISEEFNTVIEKESKTRDVDEVLRLIDRINTPAEYENLLLRVLQHAPNVVNSKMLLIKLHRELPNMIKQTFKEGQEDDNWIQDAEKDIEKRGTEGVCTGDKFGGPSCPEGSKRYNLAKTFRKMAKKRRKK